MISSEGQSRCTCGYPRTGLGARAVCPECGRPLGARRTQLFHPVVDTMRVATLAVVLALAGIASAVAFFAPPAPVSKWAIAATMLFIVCPLIPQLLLIPKAHFRWCVCALTAVEAAAVLVVAATFMVDDYMYPQSDDYGYPMTTLVMTGAFGFIGSSVAAGLGAVVSIATLCTRR